MAVNKNFVVKNGLEVSTDLILADAARNKVGIGSTTPRTELDVRGGIAATDISVSGVGTIVTLQSTTGTITDLGGTNLSYSGIGTIGTVLASSANVSGITTTASLNVSGIATIAVGIVTNLEGINLNYSGIATANSISIGATQVISNERQLQNIVSLDATTTATIESAIANAPNTFTDLNVTGISTLGTVLVSSGVITATSGIVTYYGDGAYLQNISAGVGIGTSIGLVGYGVTFINFFGAGVSTAYYSSTTGIATIYFEGGGGGSASIGIGSTPGDAFTGIITAGNLWYNTDIGRLFIYYQDTDSAQWVDAAPFNIGVLNPVSIALTSGTAAAPSLYFSGDTSTGLFQATPGQQTFVSSGASVLNVNPGGVNVTGVVTATTFDGTATTANALATNATGTNLTLSGNLTVNGTQTIINTQTLDVSDKTVGVASTSTKTALTQDGGGLVIYGPTDINFTYDRNQVAVGLNTNLSVSGVITATSFKGDGSQLSGVGLQLKSSGVSAGTGVTTIDFNGAVVSTTTAGVSTVTISGLSSTGISTAAIWSNPSFILSSIELTEGNNNYGAFGPITVAVGATVTVGIANTWVIV